MNGTDWTFETKESTKHFDDHVKTQLPWYDMIVSSIGKMSRNFITERAVVYDIGCSTGAVSQSIVNNNKERLFSLIAIDNSREMINEYTSRLGTTNITTLCQDACKTEYEKFSFAVANLSLMFMGNERGGLIKELVNLTEPGGALVIVDKFIPKGGLYSTVFNRLLWQFKSVSAGEVIDKDLSLQGIQRPLNENLMNGFQEFFRFGDFAGYVYINHGAY